MADLATRLAEHLTAHAERGYDERPAGYDGRLHAALLALLDRHKPSYPGDVEYEWVYEPVFSADGAPRGSVRMQGDPVPPYWCEACDERTPCSEQKTIAAGLGIEVADG